MWAMLAQRFRNKTSVLAYELVNEPWAGDVWGHPSRWLPKYADSENLQKFYVEIHKRIREIDDETIIFFESATGGNLPLSAGFTQGPGGPAYDDRQAYAFHVYCPIFQVSIDKNGSIFHEVRQALGSQALNACKLYYDLQVHLRVG